MKTPTKTRPKAAARARTEAARLAESDMCARLDRIALLLANETEELQTMGMEDFCSCCAEHLRTRGMDGAATTKAVTRLGERLVSRVCDFERIMGRS